MRSYWTVVIVLAFHSDNPSLNPGEAYSWFLYSLCFKRTKENKKRPGWLILLKNPVDAEPDEIKSWISVDGPRLRSLTSQ